MSAYFVRTLWQDTAELSTTQIQDVFRQLDDEAARWLEAEQVNLRRTYSLRSIDMNYVGQSFEVNVALPERREEVTMEEIARRFHERHAAIYAHADPAAPTRVMTARVQIVGVTPKPIMGQIAHSSTGLSDEVSTRQVFENNRAWDARVHQRQALKAGDQLEGPVIVEQYDTTTYVPHGYRVS